MTNKTITDDRVRRSIFPARIFGTSGNIENVSVLKEPVELQIGLSETHLAKVNGKGYVVLDFGREFNGAVRLLTQVAEGGGCRVRIRTGESVSECYAEPGEKNAGNHHTLRDITVTLPMYSDMEFLQTGFRFARIDFLEEKVVYVKAILATEIRRDLHPVGGFTCNDARVNRIFEVASETLQQCMQTYIWDGIKRDRLVWIGDMHPETTAIACLFGEDESVGRSLDYIREHTPLPAWMNNTPTYTAWWIVILHDYYEQNACTEYLKKQIGYLKGALDLINGVVREDGTIAADGSFLFDWPSHDSPDEIVGVYALWVLAAKKCRRLLEAVGESTETCDEMLSKLSRNHSLTVKKQKQCEAFLVYAGIRPAAESYEFLTEGGAKGFSTFLSYYILSAIADGGHPERAVELMKEYYGAMLDMGATTFWEDFDPDRVKGSAPLDRLPKEGEKDIHGDFGKHCYVGFRHSFCHGWSCGPVQFLIKKIGGIEILEAGCGKMRIKPVSAGFTDYRIDYPTPYGKVTIVWKDGKFDIEVPAGVELVD